MLNLLAFTHWKLAPNVCQQGKNNSALHHFRYCPCVNTYRKWCYFLATSLKEQISGHSQMLEYLDPARRPGNCSADEVPVLEVSLASGSPGRREYRHWLQGLHPEVSPTTTRTNVVAPLGTLQYFCTFQEEGPLARTPHPSFPIPSSTTYSHFHVSMDSSCFSFCGIFWVFFFPNTTDLTSIKSKPPKPLLWVTLFQHNVPFPIILHCTWLY